MKKCRCSNGKYSVRCCKSQGVGTSASTPKAYTPKYSTYGTNWAQRARLSGAASRRMSNFGNIVENLGKAQLANSFTSMPSTSGKIWTPMSRKEAKIHSPGMLKNSRKYDWQPKGESINWETKNSPTLHASQKRLRGREAHWARRPIYNQGIYSQPTQSEIYYHRRSQKRKGIAKIGIGKSMKVLGNGLLVVQLGTYAWWMYEDPSSQTATRIVKDLTLSEQIEEIIVEPLFRLGNPNRNLPF